MRILYVASGIPVPGTLGGSTHTLEVARGLAARGHTMHVVACSRERASDFATLARPISSLLDTIHLHYVDIPKSASLLAAPVLLRLARAVRPDIVMERYYNFAGGGLWAARQLGLPALLEVNALIVDPPAVLKRRLDDALGGPMRRWALTQCQWASRIVTPLHTTVPPEIPRSKIAELSWGANVDRFEPRGWELGDRGCESSAHLPSITSPYAALVPYPPSPIPHPPRVVFLGSFRAWHGVLDFVKAAAMLLALGHSCHFLLIGDGPERAAAEQLASAWPGHFTFTGAVPYDKVPELLAGAAIGVAPFNTAPHPALRAAGFFWSPLKIYEYMAAGLPVVTANIPPLNSIIRDDREGALFAEGDIAALAGAVARLLGNPAHAQALGQSARARVAEHYSWARHCAELERIMLELVPSG